MATPTRQKDTVIFYDSDSDLDLDLQAILFEQNHETTDLDLDFAFNLQMQEAITASLPLPLPIHQPSTSHSPPRDDYMALLLDDMERLELERRDREASERLTREMREDLDRRIHDQKVASEIMNMSDDVWKKDGDNYHRPYYHDKEGFLVIGEESFKLYCKGMESEERVRDRKVIVGGVGVAVCDSRDNVILEVSKGVGVFGVGEGAVVVVIEALIEGLNAALSMDLKKVNFLFDDYMVYQYVTGRVQPKQSKISTLVGKVSLLQTKFTDCKPSLVACSDIKFAYKLAKDAILSQITWPEETGKGKTSLKETCVICYEDTDVGQMFSVDGCLHRYCFSCMKQHVEVKLLNGMEAMCPHEGCKSEVSIDTCVKFLDPKLVEIMSQRKKEASIAIAEKVYCPHLRCSALMSKKEVLEYTKTSFVGAEKSGARKCLKCQHLFCINCRVRWHYNMTCYDYKISNPCPPAADAMLNTLAKSKKWRQCVKCSHMVELAEGCYHITCRCGYEFCYICGAQWKNKKPTCACPIWDERNIVRDRPRH